MSFASAANMEVEVEQYGTVSTFMNDIIKLFWFVRRYNNTFPEYVSVARMYLFGTPIRRTGAAFRRATPGCVHSSCAATVVLRLLAMRPLLNTPSLRDTQVHPAQAVLEQTGE